VLLKQPQVAQALNSIKSPSGELKSWPHEQNLAKTISFQMIQICENRTIPHSDNSFKYGISSELSARESHLFGPEEDEERAKSLGGRVAGLSPQGAEPDQG